MNLTSKETTIKEFEGIIKNCPPIFDEILVKLASEQDLPEKDIIQLKNDVLFTALVVMMIENGFRPKLADGELLEGVSFIDYRCFVNWKLSSGTYEAEFMLGCCEISTKLMMIPLATTVMVNAVIKGIELETYSVCLPINQFIIVRMCEPRVAKLFRNLQLLSDTFKNKIVSPVKSKLLTICGYPGASLMGLPEDVFLKLMLYLPISDILSMRETCRMSKQMLDDNNFWHKLFIRDKKLFKEVEDNQWYRANKKSTDPNKYDNWKSMYTEYYVECKNIKLVQRRIKPSVQQPRNVILLHIRHL
ncbi:F-box only protein 7-like [Epargyreus clarus]|uniref:F-box only protein 7-like n=1 Tax=Epargyreus clarus TaxID=520877 RepID=UPI003C2BFBCB